MTTASSSTPAAIFNLPLFTEIQELYNNDQEGKILTDHFARIKKIIEQYRWPGISLVGKEGSQMMWVLVQHCDNDLEFQTLCLKLLRIAVANNDASKENLAFLTDRVHLQHGHRQIFGTQFYHQNNNSHPFPIEDEANLDQRRRDMGLMPFSEYVAGFKQLFPLEKSTVN
jgi:hypothetical protein